MSSGDKPDAVAAQSPQRQVGLAPWHVDITNFQLFSVILWFLSLLLVGAIVASATFLRPHEWLLIGNMMSRPHLMEKITPILILLMFGWVLIELFLQTRRVYREHKAVDTFELSITLLRDMAQYQPRDLAVVSRADERADLIIKCVRQDSSSVHDAVPGIAAIDAGVLAGSYGPLHIYAWVLPVLGFIGTASGMASAIGGFKEALRTGSGQIEALASQLSETVIPGLSAAFETTILALAASLVTYVCTSALKAWDQEALDELDRRCIVLLAQIPSRSKENYAQRASLAGEHDVGLQALTTLQNAADAIDRAAASLSSASKKIQEAATAPYHVTITRGERP